MPGARLAAKTTAGTNSNQARFEAGLGSFQSALCSHSNLDSNSPSSLQPPSPPEKPCEQQTLYSQARDECGSRAQVAEERRLGLTPALHMDAKDERVQCQLEINFIDCVVTPLWEHCAHCFPALQPCMERVRANRAAYAALANCSNEEVAQVSIMHLKLMTLYAIL